MDPVVCTAPVNYQTQFIGCFKGIEMDILNSFFGACGCSLWLTYLCFLGLYSKCFNHFGDLLVFLSSVEQGVKGPAFWKGKIMLLFRETAQMLFMSIQKRGVCTLLSG